MQTKGSSTSAISTKVSGKKLMLNKLNAYAINWTDSRVTMLETMKYQKANNIEQTQESMITYLARQFKVDIKVAFAMLIGKVGGSAQTVVPMEITFMDNGRNIFVLDEFIEQMNSYI